MMLNHSHPSSIPNTGHIITHLGIMMTLSLILITIPVNGHANNTGKMLIGTDVETHNDAKLLPKPPCHSHDNEQPCTHVNLSILNANTEHQTDTQSFERLVTHIKNSTLTQDNKKKVITLLEDAEKLAEDINSTSDKTSQLDMSKLEKVCHNFEQVNHYLHQTRANEYTHEWVYEGSINQQWEYEVDQLQNKYQCSQNHAT